MSDHPGVDAKPPGHQPGAGWQAWRIRTIHLVKDNTLGSNLIKMG
jgi:hypothetical protein